MRQKVQNIVNTISENLSSWKSVDALLLADSAEVDIYDPYFFLSFDVYCNGAIPVMEERKALLPESIAFESSGTHPKDRFLLQDVPIRLEYKEEAFFEALITDVSQHLSLFNQIGTYPLYRLAYGAVILQKGDWIGQMREQMNDLPDSFWNTISRELLASMGHALSDLLSAAMHNDNYFFVLSSATFIKKIVSILFIANREFEPSSRRSSGAVLDLPNLPENFRGRFDNFLRQDGGVDLEKKAEIAELIAKSVISMG